MFYPFNENKVSVYPPIYLIPDVTGDRRGLHELAHQLSEKYVVYIYQDPRLEKLTLGSENFPLIAQAQAIVSSLPTMDYQPYPVCFAVYSEGGPKTVLASLILRALGHDPHIFLIDSPDFDTSKKYFNSDEENTKKHVTEDMYNILNYAARLSNFRTTIQLSLKELSEISEKPFLQRLDEIARRVIEAQNRVIYHNAQDFENELASFKQYVSIIQQNLLNLREFKEEDLQIEVEKFKLKYIKIIQTNETLNKCPEFSKGWERFGNCSYVVDSPLNVAGHKDLMTGEPAAIIAKVIEDTLAKELTPEEKTNTVVEKCAHDLRNYVGKNEGVTMRAVVDRLYERLIDDHLPNESTSVPISKTDVLSTSGETVIPMDAVTINSSGMDTDIIPNNVLNPLSSTKSRNGYHQNHMFSSTSNSDEFLRDGQLNTRKQNGFNRNTRSGDKQRQKHLHSPRSTSPEGSPPHETSPPRSPSSRTK